MQDNRIYLNLSSVARARSHQSSKECATGGKMETVKDIQ